MKMKMQRVKTMMERERASIMIIAEEVATRQRSIAIVSASLSVRFVWSFCFRCLLLSP